MIIKKLHMKNCLEDVDRVVMSLKATATGLLSEVKVFKLEICAAEVLTNIVKHAHTSDKDEPIQVVLLEGVEVIDVEFYDPIGAEFFDLRDHARSLSDVNTLAESGRGLGLILNCADHIVYEPSDDRNCLVLKFLKENAGN